MEKSTCTEVAEGVTEAATNWMTVESRIEMYASWERCFKKVAEHAEGKATREKGAHQIEKRAHTDERSQTLFGEVCK